MSKKIGIDIRCLCEESWSGVGEYTYNLLNTLFKIDRENEYFLFYNSFSSTRYIEPLKKWNYSNIHFCGSRIPNKLLNLSLKFLGVPKIDKLIRKNLDYFLLPNLNFISLSREIKQLLVIHDLSFEIYPSFFSPKSVVWHKLINPKKLCMASNKIIAVSKNTANDISNIYGIDPEKIKTIYPGIKNIEVSETKLKEVKEYYNLPEKFILYLGNIEPRKNILSLLDAFEIFKEKNSEYILIIIGSIGYRSKHIFKKLEKNKFGNDIRVLNYIPNKDKLAFYKLADLFVFPSFYEGFGFPPLEAMSQETPVISSITSSLTEVVGDAGLLTDPYNINELAYLMDGVVNNKKLRDELTKRGIEKIKYFHWKTTAEKFLNIIK